jgi:hypothetical protein
LANDIDEPTSSLQFSFDGSDHGATLSSSGLFSWTPSWDMAQETQFTFHVVVADSDIPELQAT